MADEQRCCCCCPSTDIEVARGVHQQSDVIELIETGEYALLQMRLLFVSKCDGLDSAERRVHKGTDQQLCSSSHVASRFSLSTLIPAMHSPRLDSACGQRGCLLCFGLDQTRRGSLRVLEQVRGLALLDAADAAQQRRLRREGEGNGRILHNIAAKRTERGEERRADEQTRRRSRCSAARLSSAQPSLPIAVPLRALLSLSSFTDHICSMFACMTCCLCTLRMT